MFRVAREIKFCYGHRLLNYEGKCRYLHGHNGTAVITLEGEHLDDRGMLVDFTDLKTVMGRWIDENLDHRMLLRHDDPILPALHALGEPVFVMDTNPTAEAIARLLFDAAAAHRFPVVEVRLWETESSVATYAPRGAERWT
jgi:6-pyruvoyltetrahydropterin/6-carboxytetrahydropterin synthase